MFTIALMLVSLILMGTHIISVFQGLVILAILVGLGSVSHQIGSVSHQLLLLREGLDALDVGEIEEGLPSTNGIRGDGYVH